MALGQLMEVILYVQDMTKQVAFYRDVMGLTLKEPATSQDFSQVYWAEFDTGACILALHAGANGRIGEDAPAIVFCVSDMEASRNELLEKGVRLGAVRSPVKNHLVCDGADPEGNKFSLEARTKG